MSSREKITTTTHNHFNLLSNQKNHTGLNWVLLLLSLLVLFADALHAGELQTSAKRTGNADLHIHNLQGVPIKIGTGKDYHITWQVDNAGAGYTSDAAGNPVSHWVDRVVASVDNVYGNGDDYEVGTFEYANPLLSGESYTGSVSGTVPAAATGTFYVLVKTDHGGMVHQSPDTEPNTILSNQVTISADTFPDLVTKDLMVSPSTIVPGATYTVTYTGFNQPYATANARVRWIDDIVLISPSGSGSNLAHVIKNSMNVLPNTGYDVSRTFTLPSTTAPGDYQIKVKVNASWQCANDPNPNNTSFVPFTILPATTPDLTITGVTADATAVSGEMANVSFNIENLTGNYNGTADFHIAVSEDDAIGGDLVVFDQSIFLNLTAGVAAAQSFDVPVPVDLDAADVHFVVTIDPLNTILEVDQTNNAAIAAAPTTLTHRLFLEPTLSVVPENRDPAQFNLEVRRGGSVTTALTVNLTADPGEADELTIPATVTIPAGQAGVVVSAEVQTDDVADGDQVVHLTASATDMADGTATVTVTDVDNPALTLTGPPILVEGASDTFRITRDAPYTAEIIVSLMAQPDGVLIPVSSLTLPAGAAYVDVSLTADNDFYARNDQILNLGAAHPDYRPAHHSLTVEDDDFPTLDLILDLAQVSEAGALTGSINVISGTLEELNVRIDGGDQVTPQIVTLDAGVLTAPFTLTPVDNSVSDGNRTVTINAVVLDAVTGADIATADSQSLTITDDEAPSLFLSLNRDVVAENTPNAVLVTLSRNQNTTSALTVTIGGSPGDITAPATAVIPSGQTATAFTLDTLDDGVTDGDALITLTADAAGYNSAAANLLISDSNVGDLAGDSLSAPAAAALGDTITITYNVRNQGLVDVPAFTETLWLSRDPFPGNDIVIAQTTASALAAGIEAVHQQLVDLDVEPGDWYLILTLDDADLIDELSETNNTVVGALPITLTVPYTATVDADITSAPNGTTVTLTGLVTDTTGAPAANEEVTLHINVKGTHRQLTAYSGPAGTFTAFFHPLPYEAGHYTVAASHPLADIPAAQDTFDLYGLRANAAQLNHRLLEGEPATALSTSIQNLADIATGSLTLTQLDTPTHLSLTGVGLSAPTIAPDGAVQLNYTAEVTGSGAAAETVRFRIQNATTGLELTVPVTFTITPATPVITLSTARLDTAVLRGAAKTVTVTATNQGGVASGPMTLFLPEVEWLNLATPMPFSLDVGESAELTLILTPAETVPFGPYSGSMVLNGELISATSLPYDINVVSDATGDLQILAVDEAYYFDPTQPALADAHVVVRDATTLENLHTATTDASGLATFNNLTEGYYQVEVHKPGHTTWRHSIRVDGATLNQRTAFLAFQAVTYTWNVFEDIIEDRYIINIGTTFETVVPKPVVTVEPNMVDLFSLDTVGEVLDMNFKVTNHGLIAADNTNLSFVDHPDFQVDVLSEDLGALAAGEERFVPVRFTRLNPVVTKRMSHQCYLPGVVRYSYNCDGEVTNETPIAGWTGRCGPSSPHDQPGPGGLDGDDNQNNDQGTGHVFGGAEDDVDEPHCGCTEFDLVCHDFSAIFKPPAEMLETYLESQLGGVIDFGVTPKAKATLSVCCDEDGNSGLSGAANASLKITAKPRTDIELNANQTIDLGTGTLVVSGKIWGGLLVQPYITAAGFVNVDCEGDLDYGMSATAGVDARFGVQGTLTGTITPFNGVPYKVELKAQGIIAAHAYATVSYSRSGGLSICSTSDGLYANLSVTWPGGSAGLWDGENYYIVDPNSSCGSKTDLALETALSQAFNTALAKHPGAVPSDAELQTIVSHWLNGETQAMMASAQKIQTQTAVMDAQPIADNNDALIQDGVAKLTEGVCAKVKLNIEQNAVLARSIFRANLDLINQDTTQNVEDVFMNIFIVDADGADAADLFEVRNPALTNITAVDGTGVIAPGQTGSISWAVIPSEDAAPGAPTNYYIGGTLTYSQPLTGNRRVIPLEPARITVKPTPALHISYFHQRDAFADDPFTTVVEPTEPFSLGMIVENRGAGAAHNLHITSGQPQIIENQKGLAIGFQIIGSEIDGAPATPSLTADFGDVAPGERRVARWQMTSTLHGHFIDYEADFAQADGLDQAFSQLKEVTIHETNRVVQVDQPGADSLPDFLVNDIVDVDDTPDTLYQSNGEISPVTVTPVTATSVSGNDVTISGVGGSGWTYLHGDDHFAGAKILDQVFRADGTALSTQNFWTTDRTFIGRSLPPVYEYRVHILDLDPGATYTLRYVDRPADTTAPNSSVNPLAADSPNNFLVTWTGSDDLSANLTYDIYVSTNSGAYERWLNQTSLDGAVYTGTAGDFYQFYSVAHDAAGNVEAAPAGADAQTTASLINHAPVLSPPTTQNITEGQSMALTLSASDPDGDHLTYSLSAAPAGLQLNAATGELTWSTAERHGGASYTVNLTVADNGIPALMDTATLTINVAEDNQAPRLPALGDINGRDDSALLYSIPAQDSDFPAQTLTYSLLAGPTGMTMNPTTGMISWPSPSAGNHTLTVSVTDGGLSATRDYNAHIQHINHAPVATGAVADQAHPGGPFNLALDLTALFNDPDSDPLTTTANLTGGAALPAWLSYNPTTATFSGLPLTIGSWPIQLTASDPQGAAVSISFQLNVTAPTRHLTVTAVPTEGGVVTGSGHYGDGETVPVTATTHEGYHFINWTGAVADATAATTTITLTADETVTANFGLNHAPVVANPIPNMTASVGEAFNQTITTPIFTDEDPWDPTVTVDLFDMPSWLTYSGGGFAGTPGTGHVGTTTITVRGTDSHGETVELTFTMTVTNLMRIVGSRWIDNDGDGVRDAGETPYPGLQIYLDHNQNGRRDSFEPSTLTQADGSFTFDVTPGTYTIRETEIPGLPHVLASGETHTLELANSAPVAWMTTGDFDNNGLLDMAAQLEDDDEVWLGLGQVNAQPLWFSYPTNPGLTGLAYDFNGDGYDDLILADSLAGQILFHQNDGRGGLLAGMGVAPGIIADKLLLIDWNNDGLMEFLAIDLSRGEIIVTSNYGGRPYVQAHVYLSRALNDAAVGYFMGNKNYPELVTADAAGTTRVYPDFNQPTVSREMILSDMANALTLTVADLNNDHLDDLVAGMDRANEVRIKPGTATGFQTPIVLSNVMSVGPLSLMDVDDNGHLDLITSNDVDTNAYIMVNQGFGDWLPTRTLPLDSPAHTFAGMNMDRDGDTDLITAGHGLPYYHSNQITRVNVPAGAVVTNHRGLYRQSAGVTGFVWHDRDLDGIRDAEEPVLNGWRVFIDHNNNGMWDSGEPETLTVCGAYSFGPLDSDGYTIVVERPHTWWRPTRPVSGSVYIEPEQGEIIEQDFGFATRAIIIASPLPGKVLLNGDRTTIRWTLDSAKAAEDLVHIELSTDQGETWVTLFDQTPNDGAQDWTVEAKPSSQCLIRITSTESDEVVGVSEGAFSIQDSKGAGITVISPNGGEVYDLGRKVTLSWETQQKSEFVAIELSTDGGKSWGALFEVANTGSVNWNVSGKASGNALIRVVDETNGVQDQSDSPFTIRAILTR